MLKRLALSTAVAFLVASPTTLAQTNDSPGLLRSPTLSETHVAFAYAGDLWTVPRAGGTAVRLTDTPNTESDPVLSPDGSRLAFTVDDGGNRDVYVMPAEGGESKRLTYHPVEDRVVGWTPDGRSVLFRSTRKSANYAPRFAPRLFTVTLEGGLPSQLPLPRASEGSFSPDGSRIAYVPLRNTVRRFKGYRGGATTPIRLAELATSRTVEIPRENSNDFAPMWMGDRIYFLSDRDGPVSLYVYEPGSGEVHPVLPDEDDERDIRWASAGPDAIVYHRLGSLHLLDPETGTTRRIEVRIEGKLPELEPRGVRADRYVEGIRVAPAGDRVAVEARGEILVVGTENGRHENLTKTSGVAERSPVWSPDGDRIAYFSDATGQYALYVRGPADRVREFRLDSPPTFHTAPVWSPDGDRIAYVAVDRSVRYVNLTDGTSVLVGRDTLAAPGMPPAPAWSPDGRRLAFVKRLSTRLRSIRVYSLECQESRRVTSPLIDAVSPAFDASGERLFFLASPDIAPLVGPIEWSRYNRPATRTLSVISLRNDGPSGGTVRAATASERTCAQRPAAIDPQPFSPADLRRRTEVVSLPVARYTDLAVGTDDRLFILERQLVRLDAPHNLFDRKRMLHALDLGTEELTEVIDSVDTFQLSGDRRTILYRSGRDWKVVAAAAGPPAKPEPLELANVEIHVDPRAEWGQIYREAWRTLRDYFYDPGYHGLDLAATERRYAPYLHAVASREDLNYLLEAAFGELGVSHIRADGGDRPETDRVPVGVLAADFDVQNGRYRLTRIYRGDPLEPVPATSRSWREEAGPLATPGLDVDEGDYLLAVDGEEVTADDNLYRFFRERVDEPVTLTVASSAAGSDAHEVSVTPAASEHWIRYVDWVDANRRTVEELSQGRLGYVHVPNTGRWAFLRFKRYFYAHTDKEGIIVDIRYNDGGSTPEWLIDQLRRAPLNSERTQHGSWRVPATAVPGPRVMVIDEHVASGGEWLAWAFRETGLGPLVGKRTKGAGVGVYPVGAPLLVDGGFVAVPSMSAHEPDGRQIIENRGVAPDIEVDLDPAAWRAGRDPQLEKAVEVALKALEEEPARESGYR